MSRSIRAEQQIEVSPYSHHLEEFLTFLQKERGFADATLVNRQRSLKPFLAWLNAQGIPLSAVSPVVITKYFTGTVAGRWKRTTVSFHVQSLRSFFRYASSRGWCAAGIAESIDAPRVYTYENLPQGPSWEEVKKLLATVNGTSPVQIRSRCAILLCSVYGLRVGEVCCLRLEDIDWAEERISVRRPKQRKAQTYSLTTEVGNALLRYLKEVRPRCAHREVLLTLRRPYRPVSVGALSTMTRKLQKRLGLKLKRYGSHVLRHACATHLLAQGLTLKEVGDHLGHMSVGATRIYAKVDLVGLREVAAFDVRPLVDCIQQCEQSAAPFYRIGEIQALRHELADDLPPVIGDRVQLQQVILNLVRNAADAMNGVEDRPRELLIKTEYDEGDRVRLSVKDAGVGFTPQAADKLFDAFFTTKSDGMGIGLSISRSIIEAHRGRLWATANNGPGATFAFSIPCRRERLADAESRVNGANPLTRTA